MKTTFLITIILAQTFSPFVQADDQWKRELKNIVHHRELTKTVEHIEYYSPGDINFIETTDGTIIYEKEIQKWRIQFPNGRQSTYPNFNHSPIKHLPPNLLRTESAHRIEVVVGGDGSGGG